MGPLFVACRNTKFNQTNVVRKYPVQNMAVWEILDIRVVWRKRNWSLLDWSLLRYLLTVGKYGNSANGRRKSRNQFRDIVCFLLGNSLRRLNFICRRFGTLYLFHVYRLVGDECLNEDGTDRVFRDVGILNSDAGELPKRKHTTYRTRRKFAIKNSKINRDFRILKNKVPSNTSVYNIVVVCY
jgi:hypothetical protein